MWYLVKWQNLPSSAATWLHARSLAFAQAAIEDFRARTSGEPRCSQNSLEDTMEIHVLGMRTTERGLVWMFENQLGERWEMTTEEGRRRAPAEILDFLLRKMKLL